MARPIPIMVEFFSTTLQNKDGNLLRPLARRVFKVFKVLEVWVLKVFRVLMAPLQDKVFKEQLELKVFKVSQEPLRDKACKV